MIRRCASRDEVQYPGRNRAKIIAARNAYESPKRSHIQSEKTTPAAGTRNSFGE
jgi:hypothetical protein